MQYSRFTLLAICLSFFLLNSAKAEIPPAWKISQNSRGDRMIDDYFRRETALLTHQTTKRLEAVKTMDDWKQLKTRLRVELFEMLSLDPLPEKTPLKAQTTRTLDHAEFTVENVHFQSMPGLYVTGNLYIPKVRNETLPTVLYVCGHGRVKKNGISYGNKTFYQHHGSWFARNGYVCFVIDTLQLGEVEGIHHGTHRYDEWWWNAKGYSSAAVEAWNCIRALDYLESREEVDAKRMGVTGRSGGGAYSWWITGLDDRIKVAVPVAGVATLENHVVDGCIEGHCDCMFMVNTYRWDYPLLAAIHAPNPLLISNSDKDRIFPLNGVVDIHFKVKPLYALYDKPRNFGLQITEGPHKDTQELRIHAFHWFNKFLKGQDPSPLIDTPAVKFFEPEELKVFNELPADEINTKIQHTFSKVAKTPLPPQSLAEWDAMKNKWRAALNEKSFQGWPKIPSGMQLHFKQVSKETSQGIDLTHFTFSSQLGVELDLYLMHREGLEPDELDLVVLNTLDEQGWIDFTSTAKAGFTKAFDHGKDIPPNPKALEQEKKMFEIFKWGMAYVTPRGIGLTQWSQEKKKKTHIRRRFMQLGQTLDSTRVWDIRRAIQALHKITDATPLWLQGKNAMAGNALYASLYEPNIARLDLWNPPKSHMTGPIYLNLLRFLDMPQATALAAENSQIRIYQKEKTGWEFPIGVSKNFNWNEKQIQVRVIKD